MIRDKEYKILSALITKLLESPAHPGEIHECPICGGHLHLTFDIYWRGNRKLVGIQGWCEECDLAIAVDSANLPSWLIENEVLL